MKLSKLPFFILFIFLSISIVSGQRNFRLIDPNNQGARYGKTPESGPPFLYFSSTNQSYHIDATNYTSHTTAVSSAFTRWNNVAPVQFSNTSSSGLPLRTFSSSYRVGGIVNPGQAYTSHSNYSINSSNSYVQLNTFHTWSDDSQDLLNDVLDVESILVHELGHIQGIAHPASFTSGASAPTMAGGDNAYFNNTLECRSLETDDIDAVIFLQLRVPSLYSSLQTALSTASSIGVGYVYLTQNYTLSSNQTVASGVTLIINSGVTLNLNSYSVISTGGTIVNNGATINGYRAIVKSGSDIKGIYPTSYTVQQLIDLCSSGWSINLVPGTYTENLAMKAGVSVVGAGPGSTIITGTVTFDNDSHASLSNCTVNNKITILSNSSGVTLSDITAGSSSCYLDVTVKAHM
jgi:hypothetical protein